MVAQLLRRFNFHNTLTQFAVFMTLLAGLAILDAGDSALRSASMFIIGTATVIVCSHIIQSFRPIVGFQTVNLYITSVICFLLIHPTQPTQWLILTICIAAALKYIIHPPIRLINPAAAAISATYLISKLFSGFAGKSVLFVSWWGTDFTHSFLQAPLIHIFIAGVSLLGCLYFVISFRKTLLAGTFFMTFMALITLAELSQNFTTAESLLFIQEAFFGSIAFFTCIMVCEPKTSPQLPKHQLIIGVLGGILAYVLTRTSFEHFSFADPFITTLLLMNLATYPLKKYGILK